ncbi:MAG: hypothetical protein GDA49_08745 [Rhodospirillales bacterium]|nr:hypothetical protein [Rhodospirillales bacterium]
MGRPILLVTAPEACARLGPAYLLAMMRQAGADGDIVAALIDCGPDAGYAMLALRVGWRDLHLTGSADTLDRVAAMAEAVGGTLHRSLPEAFDLSTGGPVDQRLERWLAESSGN